MIHWNGVDRAVHWGLRECTQRYNKIKSSTQQIGIGIWTVVNVGVFLQFGFRKAFTGQTYKLAQSSSPAPYTSGSVGVHSNSRV